MCGLSLGLGLWRVCCFSWWASHISWPSNIMDFLHHCKLSLRLHTQHTLECHSENSAMLHTSWLSTFCNFGAKLIALHTCESNTTWVMLSVTASIDRARSHWSTAEAITVCLHSWTRNHTAEELFSRQPCWRLSLSFQRFSFEMSLCCYIFTFFMSELQPLWPYLLCLHY